MASGSGAHGCSYSQRPGTDSWEEEQKKRVTLVSLSFWGLNAVFATECSIFQMTELLTDLGIKEKVIKLFLDEKVGLLCIISLVKVYKCIVTDYRPLCACIYMPIGKTRT